MIYNLFIKDTNNVGDAVCGAFLYFTFVGEQKTIDITKWREHAEDLKDSYVIIGGGGLFHLPSPTYNEGHFGHIKELQEKMNKMIVWGAGHNIHDSEKIEYPKTKMSKFKLIGVRDVGTEYEWVPCPSCMSQLFNIKYPIEQESIYYGHETFHDEELVKLLPTRYCCTSSFEEAVRFLGSAKIVYTNSYHGAYWSLLLGKTVVVKKYYSSKFFGLSSSSEKCGDSLIIYPKPNYLTLCRVTNQLFFEKVKKYIKEN